MSIVHLTYGLKPGRWRKRICKVWRGQNGWWWDECAVSLKDRKRSVDLYSLLGVQSIGAALRWWGGVDWGRLGMLNVRLGMIGCRPVEMWWWQEWDVRVEGGRLGMNVWIVIVIKICYSATSDMNPQKRSLLLHKKCFECLFKLFRFVI